MNKQEKGGFSSAEAAGAADALTDHADIWQGEALEQTRDKKGENFPVGSRLIAKPFRKIVHAYYKFARMADDISDSDLPRDRKLNQLASLKSLMEQAAGEGTGENACAAHPRADVQAALAIAALLRERDLPLSLATDLLEAFSCDAVKLRYNSWEELLDYCRLSANPVGRFLLALHGEAEESFGFSDALCTSLQILNHLQDAKADLEKLDRCYIPLPWLTAEGEQVEDLSEETLSPPLRRVFDRILREVEALNKIAAELPSKIRDRRMRLEASVIVHLCHILTDRLKREDPLKARVKLTKGDGVKALWRSLPAFFARRGQ